MYKSLMNFIFQSLKSFIVVYPPKFGNLDWVLPFTTLGPSNIIIVVLLLKNRRPNLIENYQNILADVWTNLCSSCDFLFLQCRYVSFDYKSSKIIGPFMCMKLAPTLLAKTSESYHNSVVHTTKAIPFFTFSLIFLFIMFYSLVNCTHIFYTLSHCHYSKIVTLENPHLKVLKVAKCC